ncbi:MAG TPA: SO2930 family diheme c-type cytochrome [Pirellulales bacterium]|nr:SO2930 family diheme c-type cytochrome [Pirellulales bacterium]
MFTRSGVYLRKLTLVGGAHPTGKLTLVGGAHPTGGRGHNAGSVGFRPRSLWALPTLLWIAGALSATCRLAAADRPTRQAAIEPGPTAQTRLQTALIEALPGDTIELAAGTFDFTATLSLDVPNVTLRGQGRDDTVLNFAGLLPGTGGEGLSITSGGFTLEDLAVMDVPGDAVKVTGADGVTLRRVRVEWTGGAKPTNGSYGLYPVLCDNVLVEDCDVSGSSDAGIYVGQSRNIIVRRNRARQNVAGIEIENSVDADVHDNELTDNAAGILVFTLPDLVRKEGRDCRVFKNRVVANNHENFAPKGNIVAQVPAGTGIMVMAADRTEIFDNDLADNQTVNLVIVSYLATKLQFTDREFDPYPEAIFVYDNRFAGGGDKPAGELALLKVVLFRRTLPDIIYDWAQDPAKLVAGKLPDELQIRLENNGDADFARIDLASAIPDPKKVSQDIKPFVGTLPPLPAVTLAAAATAKPSRANRPAPRKLSEYRLFEGDGASQQPLAGVVAYDVATPLFSDYTVKHRFVQIPKGKRAVYTADGTIELPVGTRIAKTFAMPHDLRRPEEGERLLETRILERTAEGWTGLAYVWNDDETEALLQVAGGTLDVHWIHSDGQDRDNNYIVPNVNQCKGCHTTGRGMQPIGLKARHLNHDFTYAEGAENQLAHWARVGALIDAPAPDDAPRLAAWDDATAPLERRARAWLDVNCAHCHQPGGPAQNAGLDLLAGETDRTKLGILKPPVAAGTGSGGRLYDIVPGKPEKSILMIRILSTHPDVMMPELGKRLVHEEGVELIRQWIAAMK